MVIKKNIILIFILLLVLSTLVVACGSGSGSSSKNKKTVELVIATGGLTGTYFPIGTAIGQAMGENTNFKVTAQTTSGSVANLRMLNQDEVELVLAGSNTGYAGYTGEAPFDKPIKNIRSIAGLYPETFQFIVRKDSGMKTIEDVKGKKVAVGAPGSGTERTAKILFDFHGITYDDIKPEFLNFGDAVTAMKDGLIDVAIVGSGVPTAAVIDAAASMDITLLAVDKEKLKKFLADQPFLTDNTIPSGSYEGVDKDILTVAAPATLLTKESMSKDDIYELTKAMFENLDVIHAAHIQGKTITLENALRGLSIPLHPGAAKYYEEQGIDVSHLK